MNKCRATDCVAKEEETQRLKDKAAGVVARAPSYPNKRPRPSASVAAGERAKYSPLGAGFPLEKMVGKELNKALFGVHVCACVCVLGSLVVNRMRDFVVVVTAAPRGNLLP